MTLLSRSRAALLPALALAGLTAPAAHAQTVTFETAPDNFTSYTDQGVTFTAVDGTNVTTTAYGAAPNGTKGISGTDSPAPELRATISGGASSVSVDLGDRAGDLDTLFLEAFNASNQSVGFTSLLIDERFRGMQTLSLSSSNIAYAIFGARAPAINGSSVFADNFSYRPAAVAAIPELSEYAAMGMAGFALCGLMVRARRRKGSPATARNDRTDTLHKGVNTTASTSLVACGALLEGIGAAVGRVRACADEAGPRVAATTVAATAIAPGGSRGTPIKIQYGVVTCIIFPFSK